MLSHQNSTFTLYRLESTKGVQVGHSISAGSNCSRTDSGYVEGPGAVCTMLRAGQTRYNLHKNRMADSSFQRQVEQWVRDHCLAERYSQRFSREKVRLSSGGEYSFDAVSADRQIVATISTSGSRTASGKMGAAKLHKIRADLYFLLLAPAARRVVVLTEADMMQLCEKERADGRIPQGVELLHAVLPRQLVDALKAARKIASRETTPQGA